MECTAFENSPVVIERAVDVGLDESSGKDNLLFA